MRTDAQVRCPRVTLGRRIDILCGGLRIGCNTIVSPSHPTASSEPRDQTVRTAVLLLDLGTFSLQGVCRHEELLNKVLAPEGFEPLGDLCHRWVSGGDQDTCHLRNLLTGGGRDDLVCADWCQPSSPTYSWP
jgi:hypothetical protein